jgi:hypothetical protein
VNPIRVPLERMQLILHMSSLGLSLLLGLLPLQAPSARAQAPPQATARAETRLKTNDDSAASTSTNRGRTPNSEDTEVNGIGLQLVKNIVRDQRDIWTSPAHLRLGYADWVVPFAGITTGLLVTDRDVNLHQASSPSTLKNYRNLSNFGIAGMAGATGGLYLWGRITDNPHKQEAGILSGEAAVDGLLASTALKYAMGRERPGVGSFRGRFWQSGDSFPSDHAVASWAVASVLTHEYPGPLTKFLAYGAASAISISRIRGQKHFPSDVLVGSGIGWLTGWQVYRAHHRSEVGGGTAEDLSDAPVAATDRAPSAMGSPYVPLDNWIYPLLDRLVAMGAINDAILGMKPDTARMCPAGQ